MQELIQHLQDKVGVTADQAEKSLHAVKDYIVSKFPMLQGAVENMFGHNDAATTATPATPPPVVEAAPAPAAAPVAAPAAHEEAGIMDKISNVIPGQAGEKIEDFAKNAAHKAEDLFDAAKDKLSGLFGGKKD